MNIFQAMTKVLSKSVCKRNINNTEWSFVFRGQVFCVISKSDSKYFVHYAGRTTTLESFSHFMKAASKAAAMYCVLHNADSVAGGVEFYTGEVLVYKGTDGCIYTRTSGTTELFELKGNLYQHLSKHHAVALPSDSQRGEVADSINDAIIELTLNG